MFSQNSLEYFKDNLDSQDIPLITHHHAVDSAKHFKAAIESTDKGVLLDMSQNFREFSDREMPVPEIWVAYAVDFECSEAWPEEQNEEEWVDHLEMSFSILTQDKLPAVQHMGIFRNRFYTGQKHPRISAALHAVSARHFLQYAPNINKELLITRPTEKMTELLVDFLGRENHDEWINRVSYNRVNNHLVILDSNDPSVRIYDDIYPFWLIGHTVVAPLEVLSQKEIVFVID